MLPFDLRFTIRALRRSPGFAAAAIFTLSLGIGAATTIFSAGDALLFHVFPYRDASRLVVFRVHQLRPGGYDGVASPPADAVADFRRDARSFEDVAGFWNASLLLTTGEGARQVNGAWVTPNTFAFLGVPAVVGRVLLPGDQLTCVVSYRFWRETLRSDPRALGAPLTFNGTPRTLVGVMPARFQFLGADAWIPVGNVAGSPRYLMMMARLKPGVTIASATAEFDTAERRMVREYPKEFPDDRFTVSLRTLTDDTVGNLKPVIFTLFAAVAMLLAIACGNVGNLLLARATLRRREMAIRAAIGATRGRIVRQLLVESAVLAAAAGLLGCLLASFGLGALAALIPARLIPAGAVMTMQPRALWFVLAVSAATAFACGLAPALECAGASLAAPMASATRRSQGLRSALVAAEVALSLVLLTGAGLMTRTFLALTRVELGFDPSHLLSVEINLPRGRYHTAGEAQAAWNGIVERVRRLPGVAAAGVSLEVPPGGRAPLVEFRIAGRPERERTATIFGASSEDHFQTMGRAILRGRTFSSAEIAAARQVLVVNETFARTFFHGEDPIGRKVVFNMEHWIGAPADPSFEIAGVVSDVRNDGLRRPVMPEAYVPYTLPIVGMVALGRGAILIRSSVPPLTLVESVRRRIWAADRSAVLARAVTLEQAVAESSYEEPRFGLVSLGGFAAIGLALVVAGVFSVMAYTVSAQTRDIGIRVALGARPGQILSGVLRRGLAWIGAGIAVGIPASLALTRLLASQLWGVSPADPWTFATVIAIVLAAGAAACWIPARHAAGVDPLVALRHE